MSPHYPNLNKRIERLHYHGMRLLAEASRISIRELKEPTYLVFEATTIGMNLNKRIESNVL
jgi:hypothetical protein